MNVEPELKQRSAHRDDRLGARVSANLSGLWRLACLVTQCPVEPAQGAVPEIGFSKPHPNPSKVIAMVPRPAGRSLDSATGPSEYACRRVSPSVLAPHDSPCSAALPEMTVLPARRAARRLRYRKLVSLMALSTRFLQKRHSRLTRRLQRQELHSTEILRTYL